MKKGLIAPLVLLGVLGTSAAVAYSVLLTDEARAELRKTASTIRDAYRQVNESIEQAEGQVMEEDELPNRQQTRKEWEALGY